VVAEPLAPPLAGPDALPLGGVLELGLELLPEVAPPEAEPELGFDASLVGSLALEELEEELGELGVVAELPPEGEVLDEEEPELDGGVADDGDLPLSWPQAARPKAIATAIARVESFMCPPWLGNESKQQRTGRD
jgi:hypothetical protein